MNDKDNDEDNHGLEYEPNDPGVPSELPSDPEDLFGDYRGDGNLRREGDIEDEKVIVEDVERTMDSKHEDPLVCMPCEDARQPVFLKSPVMPSAEDVKAHYLTHLPYRSWCPICIKA